MSKISPQAKNGRDRAFGVACWTLGGMAFVLLLMVGVSFSLSGRTVVVEKVVQVPVPQPVVVAPPPVSAGTGDDAAEEGPAAISDPPNSVVRPRSVEEMLRAADLADPEETPSAVSASPAGNAEAVSSQPALPSENPDDVMPAMTEEVAALVKAARYAQIEGDLKVAVLKLEQAMRLLQPVLQPAALPEPAPWHFWYSVSFTHPVRRPWGP